jgi:peptide/nickel transport system permease protein
MTDVAAPHWRWMAPPRARAPWRQHAGLRGRLDPGRDPPGEPVRRLDQPLRSARAEPAQHAAAAQLGHPFGTDNFGRDIFTRVLHAAKLDLMIGFLCVLFPWILGTRPRRHRRLLRRLVETFIMRVVDTFSAFPFLIMVIGIIAILGPGLFSLYIALTLAGWSMYARIVRAEVLVVRQSEYVLAARALGYGHLRIMFGHMLPNVITPTIIFAMTDIVLVILSTISLSFLGLGVQPPTPSGGSCSTRRRASCSPPGGW